MKILVKDVNKRYIQGEKEIMALQNINLIFGKTAFRSLSVRPDAENRRCCGFLPRLIILLREMYIMMKPISVRYPMQGDLHCADKRSVWYIRISACFRPLLLWKISVHLL